MRWKYDKRIKGAALSLRDGCALYAELQQDEDRCSLVNAEVFELPPGLVEGDHIKDPERLGSFLRKKCAFRWGKLPLALGLPSSDCIFSTFSLPAADLDEAREAMRWCFSEYFPYQYGDALFDLCEIPEGTSRGTLRGSGRLQLIGVACEKKVMMPVLEALKNSSCCVQAVEPQIVACARVFSTKSYGTKLLAAVTGQVIHLIFVKGGTALLFRSLFLTAKETASKIDEEIRRTIEYIAESFDEPDVQMQLVGSLPFSISDLPSAAKALRPVSEMAKNAEDSYLLKFISPAAPDWFDVAGLLLRYKSENRI